jgi:arylsulfatase A
VGSTSDQLVGLTDVLATLAALCGEPLPDGTGPDSFNQLPALLQKKDEIKPRSAMVTASYRGLLTLRHGDWKAIFGTKWSGGHTSKQYGGLGPDETRDDPTSGQLYNLSKDPYETKDLWESHPEIIKKLRDKLDKIKQLDKSDALHVADAADASAKPKRRPDFRR